MTDAIISGPQRLGGEISAPPSKSYTHRALIAALLSDGVSRISNPLIAEDTEATLRAITALGAKVDLQEQCWRIQGAEALKASPHPVDCGESGSTLRFMIPVSALASGNSVFTVGPSLASRPLEPLLLSLKQLGVESSLRLNHKMQLIEVWGGGIKGGEASIMGDISSQFISGLLFGCSKAAADTDISLTTPLESRDYVKMTIEILDQHGVKAFPNEDMTHFKIPANQTYKTCDHNVPGDFSSAAFLLAAAAITHSTLKLNNLSLQTLQGDRNIVGMLHDAGVRVTVTHDSVEVKGGELRAVDLDVRDTPDLAPVCASVACYSTGVSKIYNAGRLRYKESDRLSVLQAELGKMGGKVMMQENAFVVKGPCKMQGAVVDPHGDHRIAMACAVAALAAKGETVIQGCECVNKSYPRFFGDLRLLGAHIIVRR